MDEKALVKRVASHLSNRGFETESEVWVEDRKVDLLGWRRRPRRLVAVEAKLDRWKDGLRQANLTRLCADYSYLAVRKGTASRVNVDTVSRMGLGLIAVDGSVVQVIAPRYSRVKHPSLYSEAMSAFE